MMTDILLDSDGDIDLTGDQISLTPSRSAGIAQHLKIRLRFFLGEWFLDTNLGIPYFERILVKRPNLGAISQIFREAIVETAGIQNIVNFTMDFEASTRTLVISFTARLTDSAEILDFTDEIRINSIT